MDTEKEAQKLSHLPEVNERREAQAIKAPILNLRLVQQ